jgi:hypothetical protein
MADQNTTILQLQQQVAELTQLVSTLLSQQSSSNTSSIPSPPLLLPPPESKSSPLKIAPPDVFDGNIKNTDAFLSQLALYFNGKKVEDDGDKVIFALSYMKGGTAGPWAKLKVKEFGKTGVAQDYDSFIAELVSTFGDPDPATTARHKMDLLKQGSNTADQYISSFREIKDDTGYNDSALVEMFERGLNSSLVDKIYNLPEMPTTLLGWFQWSSKLDRQWRQREAKKKTFSLPSSQRPAAMVRPARAFNSAFPPQNQSPPTNTKDNNVVPMEVDSGWKRVKSVICYKCRKLGHIAANCPSSVNINSMDNKTLKAYLKAEMDEEPSVTKKDF